jgi:hypothetical protein
MTETTQNPGTQNTEANTADQVAVHAAIKANFNNLVDVVETGFHFRKAKDATTGIETKRASVLIPIPSPSVEGIIEILNTGGKQLDLLLEAVRSVITEQAREHINVTLDASAENFPYDMLKWETIANLPQAERKGGGISKETWEAFAKDYITIMPALLDKPLEAVEKAASIFLTKFSTCKSNKPVLKMLQSYLTVYIANTKSVEDYAEAVDWLSKKIDTLLESGDASLLAAL